MSDSLQLDMFKRVRAPRVQEMAYRDRGWNARGEEVVWFECPKCGTRIKAVWRHADAADGPPCGKCNKHNGAINA